MYTYIITSIITLIAIGCIFKTRENRFFVSMLIFFIVTFASGITVSLIRRNSLPVTDDINSCKEVEPIVIDRDTSYVSLDTIITDKGMSINIHKYDSLPKGVKTKIEVRETTVGAVFVQLMGTRSDSVIVVQYGTNDFLYYDQGKTIYENATTCIEHHSLDRVGDNWTVGWSLPSLKTFDMLCLCKSDIEYLKSVNPNLFSKWKVVKR